MADAAVIGRLTVEHGPAARVLHAVAQHDVITGGVADEMAATLPRAR